MKLTLPQPGAAYDKDEEAEFRRQLEAAFRKVLSGFETITLQNGMTIELAGGQLVITSPNGTRYRLVVDNAGALSTTPA